MTTRNPRYMVTIKPETSVYLVNMSKHYDRPVSGIIAELVEEALELREDLYWSKVAEEAEKANEGKKLIPADVLWKELGLQ